MIQWVRYCFILYKFKDFIRVSFIVHGHKNFQIWEKCVCVTQNNPISFTDYQLVAEHRLPSFSSSGQRHFHYCWSRWHYGPVGREPSHHRNHQSLQIYCSNPGLQNFIKIDLYYVKFEKKNWLRAHQGSMFIFKKMCILWHDCGNISPSFLFQTQVDQWESKLGVFSRTLDEWLTVQRMYLYLEPIFSAPDIQR